MEIKINHKKSANYDVIVVGSGPAGIGASLASARSGARTLLIESLGRVGVIPRFLSNFRGRALRAGFLQQGSCWLHGQGNICRGR